MTYYKHNLKILANLFLCALFHELTYFLKLYFLFFLIIIKFPIVARFSKLIFNI